MPNEISNAVGTARQFTPQPDATYQGRYQGVGVREVNPARSKWLDVADNMTRLSNAFDSYNLNHEKYLSAVGEQDATAMINSMTAEDMEKLNTIDAAQLYGFADTASNPYFRAYADKLRGNFLGTKMKEDYDAKYAMSPAQSGEEELKRYQEYSKSWRKEHLEDTRLENEPAFNKGFNENSVVNMSKLYQTWNKKKNEDDVRVTIAQVNSELGDVIANSGELLKENGAMTDKVQSIFNETRLMGLPFAYREQLLKQFTDEIVKTGHIPVNRLEQMLARIDVGATIDGSTVKAADILDMQTLRTEGLAYNLRYASTQKEGWLKEYGDKKQYDKFLMDAEALKDTDPEGYQLMISIAPQVLSRQKAKEADEKAEARARVAAAKAKAGGSGSSGKTISDPDVINEIIATWQNGGTIYNGRTIGAWTLDKDVFGQAMLNQVSYLMANGQVGLMDKIMRMPQAKQIAADLGSQFEYSLDAIQLGDDGHASYDTNTENLLNFLAYNPRSVEHLFGKQLADKASILGGLIHFGGGFQAGVDLFATWNSTDPTTREGYKKQVSDLMSSTGYTADYTENLNSNQGGTESIPIANNPDLEDIVCELASALSVRNGSPYKSLKDAGDYVAQNFYYFRGAYFPKDILNDIDSSDDRGNFQWAIDNETDWDKDVEVRYDRSSQMFYFTAPANSPHTVQGQSVTSWSKPLSYMVQAAKERAIARGTEVMEQATNNTGMSVAEINAIREASQSVTYEDDNTYGESEGSWNIDNLN